MSTETNKKTGKQFENTFMGIITRKKVQKMEPKPERSIWQMGLTLQINFSLETIQMKIKGEFYFSREGYRTMA